MGSSPLKEQGNIENAFAFFRTFDVPKSQRILDIGTRFGSLPNHMMRDGWEECVGIDIDAEALDQGRDTYPRLRDRLMHYDGTRLPFKDGDFDVVTMFDVLEHIPDVPAFLAEIRRVLRPGGLFVFQTPNILTNIPWEIVHQRSWTLWKSYHCSLQTYFSLKRLLQCAGFHNVSICKYPINTAHNRAIVRTAVGMIGIPLLFVAQLLPLVLYPNFYGSATNAS